MNRIALRLAPKSMKVEAGQVHIAWNLGTIKGVEPARAPVAKIRANLRGLTGLEQLLQAAMPEAFDHGHM